jgi:hypothetical protein
MLKTFMGGLLTATRVQSLLLSSCGSERLIRKCRDVVEQGMKQTKREGGSRLIPPSFINVRFAGDPCCSASRGES